MQRRAQDRKQPLGVQEDRGLWGPGAPGHFCLRGGKTHIFDENGLEGTDGAVGLATTSRVSQ